MTPNDEAISDLRALTRRTMALSLHLGNLSSVAERLLPEEAEALTAIIQELGRMIDAENQALQLRALEVSEPVGSA